jgi:hypothetical protein
MDPGLLIDSLDRRVMAQTPEAPIWWRQWSP